MTPLRGRATTALRLTWLVVLLSGMSIATTDAAAAEPRPDVDPYLAEQLASASPTDRLSVAVTGTTLDAALDAVAFAGLTLMTTFDAIEAAIAVGTPEQIRALQDEPEVLYLEGDRPITFGTDTSHVATRDAAARTTYRDGQGRVIDGTGVSIAVIDSGIDGTHPFFAGPNGTSRVVRNLKNVCPFLNPSPPVTGPCFVDQTNLGNDTDTESGGGHGTHVAGIAAGTQVTTTSPRRVTLRGAADGSKVIGLSVGQSLSIFAGAQGLNWVLENHRQPCGPGVSAEVCPPIRVTNNSYGPPGGGSFVETSVSVRLQRQLVAVGVLTVWAAGNDAGDGSGGANDGNPQNTNPPGQDPTPGILMAASYNDGNNGTRDGTLSDFSSRGVMGTLATYPDISAPGDGITSACRPALSVCATGLDPVNGPGQNDIGTFNTISGTSMAAPHIAGIVAQILQAGPTLTPAQVEDVLEDTAHKYGDPITYEADDPGRNDDDTTSFDKGHGLVDVAAALAEVLGAPPLPPPAAACGPTSASFVDPAGDATQAIVIDTPLPSSPSLDLRRGFLAFDPTTSVLTFNIQVTDLAAGPPVGSRGEFFRYYFSVGSGPELFVVANRNTVGQSFSLRRQTPPANVPLTGSFDVERDLVTVALPAATLAQLEPGSALTAGSVVTTRSVLGQRDAPPLTATADTAGGLCPFVVGTSAPAFEGTVDPVIPEAPVVVLLPGLAALGLGALVIRRRRRLRTG